RRYSATGWSWNCDAFHPSSPNLVSGPTILTRPSTGWNSHRQLSLFGLGSLGQDRRNSDRCRPQAAEVAAQEFSQIDGGRSEQEHERRWQQAQSDWKEQLDARGVRSFVRFLPPLLPHDVGVLLEGGCGVDAQTVRVSNQRRNSR